MKNHEDFKDLMKEDKDFGDTTQIVNRGSAARGRDRRPHPRTVETLEEAAHLEMKFEYKCFNDSAEKLWGGEPSEVFKHKHDIMLKLNTEVNYMKNIEESKMANDAVNDRNDGLPCHPQNCECEFYNSSSDRKYDMKIKGGGPFTVFENKMNQPIELEHEGKINFTPVSVKD